MGVYDQAARFAAKADAGLVPARLLAGSGLALTFREWLDTRTVPMPGGPDRTADLVAAFEAPSAPDAPWLLVLEFQAQVDADKLDVTLEEVAVLRSRVRFGPAGQGKYNVAAGFVYLRDRAPVEALDMQFPDGSGTRHAPRVWNVAEENATEALDAVASGARSWGTLFWLPLMAGADDEATISRWRESVTARDGERSRQDDLVGVALIFAELAGRGAVWKRALEGFAMTESQIVNEWIAKGLTVGRLTDRREILLGLLNKRFPGAVSPDVTKLIDQQESLDLLKYWIDAVVDADTFDDFMTVLKQ
jgi:hypothetical protein